MAIATAALVLTAIAGLATANAQKNAGKAQEIALKEEAKAEETSARERELARKKKINKVLAAQAVAQGASGVTGEGSGQIIALDSVKNETLSGLADTANKQDRISKLRNQGKTARKLGNLQAASTLINTGAKVYGGTG